MCQTGIFILVSCMMLLPAWGKEIARRYERVPEETPQGSIYLPDDGMSDAARDDIFRAVHFMDRAVDTELDRHANSEFRALMNRLFHEFKPTNHAFFRNMRNSSSRDAVRDPEFLSELYIRYQAAMHATRASVWFTPNLDTPRLRQRKAAIIVDDDTIDGDIPHHKHLENLFVFLGAATIPDETRFGGLESLKTLLDDETFAFCEKAWNLYSKSSGAWSIFEVLSDNWQSGLYNSLAPHFSDALINQSYFEEISFGHIEILHMLETVSLTESILYRFPHLQEETMQDAIAMAQATNELWDNLNTLLLTYIEKNRAANPSILGSIAAFGRVKDIQFEGEEVDMQTDGKRVFGQHAVITLEGCNLTTISSGEAIRDFAVTLVKAIEMKAFGKPFVEHFADDNKVAAGYSLAQMIETSLISGHFSEHWRAAYLDIFSCKAFKTAKAVDVAKSFFQAESARVKVLLR